MNKKKPTDTSLIQNKKAFFSYSILEDYECGIELKGTEVKSIKLKHVQFTDSYARITKKNEIFLYNLHVSPYKFSVDELYDPIRPRKLLLNRQEITKLKRKTTEKGFTLVPTKLYQKRGLIKLTLAVAQGKKLYQKKESIKKRDSDREAQQEAKRHTQS